MEDVEDEIEVLQDASNFDTPFKISAELNRLKELNGHVQEDINHARYWSIYNSDAKRATS
jgi:uncharacterized SAM-dependent methyltransferase